MYDETALEDLIRERQFMYMHEELFSEEEQQEAEIEFLKLRARMLQDDDDAQHDLDFALAFYQP